MDLPSSRTALRSIALTRQAARSVALFAGGRWGAFADWFNSLGFSENAILLGFAVGIGTIAALGVVVFYRLIDLAHYVFFDWPAQWAPEAVVYGYRPLITGAGFAAAWWIVRRFRAGEGQNVPDVQRAVARRGGEIAVRPAVARTTAAAVTLGSGGAAGSEGPVAVLGATAGSILGRLFRFSSDRTKVLVGAGAAAAIAASFNAPLAGAFFALEEILGSFAVSSFPPVVVSSVVAAVISHGFFGDHPAFPVPIEYGLELRREVFLFYPILGVIAGLVAALFVRTYFGVEGITKRTRMPPWLVPWLGGASVAVLVAASGGLLGGSGHLAFRVEVFGRMPWIVLALLAIGQIVATSLTLHTGGSGGLFTPSLFVGAATGGAFGVALTELFPNLPLQPEAYALVGMGAVVAAATGAPITGILLVFEMTNDYEIMPPLMLATVIAFVVARQVEGDNLYSGWLRRRGEHLEQGTDRDVLAKLRVVDAFDAKPVLVDNSHPVATLLERLGNGEQSEFPVVDHTSQLVGMITTADLARVAKDHGEMIPHLVAADVALPTEAVYPDDSLLEAIRRMGVRGASALPVVSRANGAVLGLLSRAHVLAVYEKRLVGNDRRH